MSNPEVPKWLADQIDSLNVHIPEDSDTDRLEGLNQLYKHLPELPFGRFVGLDNIIHYADGSRTHIRAINETNEGLLVRKYGQEGKRAPFQKYGIIRGFYLVPETDNSHDLIDESIVKLLNMSGPGISTTVTKGEATLPIILRKTGICKDAFLLWSEVHDMSEIQSRDYRHQRLGSSAVGRLVSVINRAGNSQLLFMNEEVSRTQPVKNVSSKIDGSYVPVLSYPLTES